MKKITLMIIICLSLTGCWLFPEPEPIEPVTAIMITPEYSEIGLGESVGLYCIDQLNRQVSVVWSKRCNAGTLSDDLGVSITYTTPKTMEGIQIIYATYNDLKAEARVNGVR